MVHQGKRVNGSSRAVRRPGRATWLVVAALVAPVATHALLRAQTGPAAARTVWDGVYTEPQAERGRAAFDQSCARCHSLTSEGRSPLSGPDFWESYTQRTVGQLLAYVQENMPNGNGNSLPAATYSDLVALILKSNGFPAGAAELARDRVADVQIVPSDGSRELPANALVRIVGCLARTGGDWVVVHATAPERIDTLGPGPDDAVRPLGDRRMTLRFVVTPLDKLADHRVTVSGILIGAGGVDGLNVTSVSSVATACP